MQTNTLPPSLATADPYQVAVAALPLLAKPETLAEGLQHYTRVLHALRLTAAAARLTGAVPQPGGGQTPWSSRARRFAANLKSLQSHTPAGAEVVSQASSHLAHFELHQTADGNYQVLDTRQPLPTGWVGGLQNHKAAAHAWQFDRTKPSMPLPLAFDGLAFGWPLLRVLETTANSYLNYSCAAYILESEPVVLAMLLHMHDLQPILAGTRTRWFVGTDPATLLAEYKTALRKNPTWTLPGQFVRCQVHARPPLDLEAATIALRDERAKTRSAHFASATDHYSKRTPAAWAKRFTEAQTGGTPLRVLGITSRYTTVLQHSLAELQSAATAAGATFDIAIEPDDHSLENPFLEKIAADKPDLIVQISRLRYENPNLPKNVPFLCWDQDNLPFMRTPEAKANLNPLTYVAGHGAIYGYGHLDWPADNCIFCQPTGAAHRYSAQPASPDLLAKHACDISYISNASGTPESLQAELADRWSRGSTIATLFARLCTQIHTESLTGRAWDDIALRQLITNSPEMSGKANPSLENELQMDLHRFADRCFRHATLQWISRWCLANNKTLRLYGNGWQNHPELARWAAGIAQPGEETRAIYQASRINLQLIESGFIHSRALDGLAAGGFFLTRHVPADGTDVSTLNDIHLLGKWLTQNPLKTPEDFRHAPPDMQERWQKTLKFHPWEPTHALKVVRVWAETPPPLVAFPMLPEISFHDEPSFARLATTFLNDEPRRLSLAAQMRQIMLHHFSYDSRWNQFIAAVTEGLAKAASRAS